MRLINKLILSALLLVLYLSAFAQKPVHVWQMQELTFNATNAYKNPYTEVKMWVELSGPGFNKKVFGFWVATKIAVAVSFAAQGCRYPVIFFSSSQAKEISRLRSVHPACRVFQR